MCEICKQELGLIVTQVIKYKETFIAGKRIMFICKECYSKNKIYLEEVF